MTYNSNLRLSQYSSLIVKQRAEYLELLGFETRNKYEILDSTGHLQGFAAEQQKGALASLSRFFLGHWRTFDILIFDSQRNLVLKIHHPFRFLFQRLEVCNAQGVLLGALQQKFSVIYKKFEVLNECNNPVMQMASVIWKIWTFPFTKMQREVAVVRKKWSGALVETFTDRDNFEVSFQDPTLTEIERQLILAAALFIDLQYFERKNGSLFSEVLSLDWS